ncbi:MAG: outer membrane beta-barrel protein [Bacteroidota bacterium]
MKRTFIILISLLSIIGMQQATAQISSGNPNFQQGDIDINAGVGLIRTFYSGASTVLPPLSISGEYGINDKISVGGFMGFSTARESWYGADYNYSFFILGARASYHFTIWEQLDTYGGLMLGYNKVSVSYDDAFGSDFIDYDVAADAMALSAYVGARYPISDKFTVYGELGYGISVLNIGASFKLQK